MADRPAEFDQGSDGGSLADASCDNADMGECCVPNAAAVRYEIFRFKKPAASFPARAPKKSCDDEDMPVICPTCQIFLWSPVDRAPALLLKSLHRGRGSCGYDWRRSFCRTRFNRPGNRQRVHLGSRLLLGSSLRGCAGLRYMPGARRRRGMPNSPGMRDRGSSGISNQRSRHRAHRSQNDCARYRAQSRTSGARLGICFIGKQ
jgi:hypothetical protein